MAYSCFSCGREVEESLAKRLPFRESCEQCDSDLHCCKNCDFHDPSAYNECREPQADRVLEKARANRCELFRFRDGAAPAARKASAALKSLDDLFGGGGSSAPSPSPADALDELFKKK